MLTAGRRKLTSSVDPERDPSVALGQVRPFKAVFVLEAAVRGFLGRRGVRSHVGDASVEQQRR